MLELLSSVQELDDSDSTSGGKGFTELVEPSTSADSAQGQQN